MATSRAAWSLPAGVVLLAVTACGRGAAHHSTPPLDAPVVIVVDNRNFYDATVYLYWSMDRQRLGVVTGLSRGTFRSPWVRSDLRAEVALLAGGSHLSEIIAVNPGDTVEIHVPPDLDRTRTRRIGRGRRPR